MIFIPMKKNLEGVIETREVWVTDQLEWLTQKEEGKDLNSIVCPKSTREVKDKKSVEFKRVQYRYYISSLLSDACKVATSYKRPLVY